MGLKATFNTTSIGFALVANRVVMDVNQALLRMLDYGKDELVGRPARNVYYSDEDFQTGSMLYTPRFSLHMAFARNASPGFTLICSLRNQRSPGGALAPLDNTIPQNARPGVIHK